ncbi:hypothetical protein [Chromobacterium violaceum]|uniref:hypothetical protein n=1 Tax=Chromobacterium violaceum TaxID=536 RepID=UPI001B31AB11|nr:hypothetical protein [Chromobacterium violaceum]MBP4051506.1 hypothetical protein [Chromobacterium violaceum]
MKKITAVFAMVTILAGCAHQTANPIQLAQIGDETKSCRTIQNEMQDMQNQMLEKQGDGNAQVGKNVALGVAGAFLIVPWFFMDLGNAATVEQKAVQARYKRLQSMAEDKHCTLDAQTAQGTTPVQASQPIQNIKVQ